MDKLNHVVAILKQSYHMPALLSLLVGLLMLKRESSIVSDDDVIGDNIPTSFMDGLKTYEGK